MQISTCKIYCSLIYLIWSHLPHYLPSFILIPFNLISISIMSSGYSSPVDIVTSLIVKLYEETSTKKDPKCLLKLQSWLLDSKVLIWSRLAAFHKIVQLTCYITILDHSGNKLTSEKVKGKTMQVHTVNEEQREQKQVDELKQDKQLQQQPNKLHTEFQAQLQELNSNGVKKALLEIGLLLLPPIVACVNRLQSYERELKILFRDVAVLGLSFDEFLKWTNKEKYEVYKHPELLLLVMDSFADGEDENLKANILQSALLFRCKNQTVAREAMDTANANRELIDFLEHTPICRIM